MTFQIPLCIYRCLNCMQSLYGSCVDTFYIKPCSEWVLIWRYLQNLVWKYWGIMNIAKILVFLLGCVCKRRILTLGKIYNICLYFCRTFHSKWRKHYIPIYGNIFLISKENVLKLQDQFWLYTANNPLCFKLPLRKECKSMMQDSNLEKKKIHCGKQKVIKWQQQII